MDAMLKSDKKYVFAWCKGLEVLIAFLRLKQDNETRFDKYRELLMKLNDLLNLSLNQSEPSFVAWLYFLKVNLDLYVKDYESTELDLEDGIDVCLSNNLMLFLIDLRNQKAELDLKRDRFIDAEQNARRPA